MPLTVPRCTVARADTHGHALGAQLAVHCGTAVRWACVAGFERFYGDSFIIFYSFVFPFRESTLERFL